MEVKLKNQNKKNKGYFLLDKILKSVKNLFWPHHRIALSNENAKNKIYFHKGFEPNCNFSLWLIDTYLRDLISKSLLDQLDDNDSEVTLKDCGVGVWHWDLNTDQVFYSSESLKIVEIESDDIFDNWNRWYKIIHPDDLSCFFSFMQKCFDRKTVQYEHCYRVKTSNGDFKWIIDKAKVISKDEHGRPLRVAGLHMDLSLKTLKDFEISEVAAQYIEHNKQLLNFALMVSHDLNVHSNNISLLLDVNDFKEDNDTPETFAYLRIVSNDLKDTLSYLSDLVSVKYKKDIVVEPLKINSFLKKVTSSLQSRIEEKKVVIISNIMEEAIVNFNPAYLESVLLNLTTNAIRYAHPERLPIIKFDFLLENGKKTLLVTDNGLGIDLERYGNVLFDICKTFHPKISGKGLGLHMIKNQIDSMHAKLEVNSIVDEGTCFKITFRD